MLISMDGKGRWMDSVFIERVWRSLKYEVVYLNEPNTGTEARHAIGDWFTFYNFERRHSTLGGRTPDEVYRLAWTLHEGRSETAEVPVWWAPQGRRRRGVL